MELNAESAILHLIIINNKNSVINVYLINIIVTKIKNVNFVLKANISIKKKPNASNAHQKLLFLI